MKNLVPCPSCARHVRASELACPFCRSALPEGLADAAIPGASQRMKRAAAFAFTATLSLAGCGDTVTPSPTPVDASRDNGAVSDTGTPDGTVDDNGGAMPLYGLPADASPSTDTASPSDAAADDGIVTDNGGVAPAYGIAADAGFAEDATPTDTGGGGVRYGAPPPTDAGDAGGGGVRYGAPPPSDWV